MNGNNKDVDSATGVDLRETRRNEEMLEEARVEPIAMVIIERRL